MLERLFNGHDDLIKMMKEYSDRTNRFYTGFSKLDELCNGFRRGEVITIAARPGEGKTTMSLNMVDNFTKSGYKCVLYELEMSKIQICNKMIMSRLKERYNEKEIIECLEKNKDKITDLENNSNIVIETETSFNIKDLMEDIAEYCDENESNIDILVIDHLQLMPTNKKDNRNNELAELSKVLKQLAIKLNIVVIVLSQMNRSIETRDKDKSPKLSDLRDSGAIEQDSDKVLFIAKDLEHKITVDELLNAIDYKTVYLLKNRQGNTGEINFVFNKKYSYFTETN